MSSPCQHGARRIAFGDPEWHAPPPAGHKWYLCHFAHKYLDFRTAEVESLAGMAGVPLDSMRWRMPPSIAPDMHPFWSVCLPSDEVAQKIAARSMLCKGFYELWGEGSDWDELRQSIQAFPDANKTPWITADKTFKVDVAMHGGTLDVPTQLDYMERITCVDFKGKVHLKRPDVVFRLQVVDEGATKGLGDPGTLPFRLYFGRQVAVFNHSVVQTYHLPNRPYIGPTSMDPEMAFIMCNQAQVQAGQLVCDPYIGTGSIAVAAAHHGALVTGTDIDVRVVKFGKTGKDGQPLDIYTNFRHYNMPGRLLGLVATDMHNPCWRREGLEGVYHSIVGDPPYGVRAGGRKMVPRDIEIHDRETHIKGTAPYTLGECLRDLLDHAARMLVLGGRLVFFLPATIDTYDESELPTHPALTLLYNAEQLLHKRYSRRLITMEKTRPYDAEAAAAHHASHPPTMRIDQLHEIVYEPGDRDDKGNKVYPDHVLAQRKFRGKKV